MEPDTGTREMTALLRMRLGDDPESYHTGGNCWVTQIRLADDSYIWVSDMDGPWIAGHYATDDDEEPGNGWIGRLDPNGGDPIYTAEAAAAIVARYVEEQWRS
jgi:hypothetical protein